MPEYLVDKLDYPTAREKGVAPDSFAFLHSSEFQKIFSVKKREAAPKGVVNGYLTIRSCDTGRKVYLQYKSWGIPGGKIQLSNNNLYHLGIHGKDAPKVELSRCHPLSYHYHRADTLTKVAFGVGVAGLFFSLLSLLISLLKS